MTLREAMEAGVRFVKHRSWRSGNYLELPPMLDGFHGPWCKIGVHNPAGVIAPKEYGIEKEMLFVQADDGTAEWDEITPPLRRHEEVER